MHYEKGSDTFARPASTSAPAPAPAPAISAQGLGKTYRMFRHPGDRIREFVTFGIKKYHHSFTALSNVSFEIARGEIVGIIGPNGAGKSTLLQLICGILRPTSGSVIINGRIMAMLELGAGFNPEFTGRENVYFQGALCGFSETEMARHFSEIERFADIGSFIDQPVRTYSSGMFVRLAFATTIHLDPDILILDEVLAVGDQAFQRKCFGRISDIRQRGGVVLLVSHSMEQIAHYCDRTILLDKGSITYMGDTSEAIRRHLSAQIPSRPSPARATQTKEGIDPADKISLHPDYTNQETRWGDAAATIVNANIAQPDNAAEASWVTGKPTEITFDVLFHRYVEAPIFGIAIKSRQGAMLFSSNSKILLGQANPSHQQPGSRLYVSFLLTPDFEAGEHLVSLGVISESASGPITHDRRYDVLTLKLDDARQPIQSGLPACRIIIDSRAGTPAEQPFR